MGIVYVGQDGEPSVFEAVQPVKLTPLAEWISRGEGRRFAAKRLVNADSILTREKLAAMKRVGESFAGLDYDLFSEWTDERMYCSELVWKIFDLGAGVDIGDLEALGDFDLSLCCPGQTSREVWRSPSAGRDRDFIRRNVPFREA